jgi:hypothetical protein
MTFSYVYNIFTPIILSCPPLLFLTFFLAVLGFELELSRQALYHLSHAPSLPVLLTHGMCAYSGTQSLTKSLFGAKWWIRGFTAFYTELLPPFYLAAPFSSILQLGKLRPSTGPLGGGGAGISMPYLVLPPPAFVAQMTWKCVPSLANGSWGGSKEGPITQ